MKRMVKRLPLFAILAFNIFSFGLYAQTQSYFEHKIVAGFNIGATTPIPIPQEVRGIDAYWPEFTPQLGYNITYRYNKDWGVTSGILLDYKGMGARNRVKYMHTSVILEREEGITLDGYFVGRNETRVKSAYVTVPLYLDYTIDDKWKVRFGGYASYRFSAEFKGTVWDGYMRIEEFTGERFDIKEKGEARFNFGDDMRDFDFGLSGGGEYQVNDRFGVYGNLSWGLTSVFPNSFKSIEFKMYNIYFAVGLTYRL